MEKETALMTLSDTMSLGSVLAKSGYFSDAKGEAQAVVKVLAGREMGFGPIASMTGVHIVQGKPTVGANLLGAAIKGSGKYDYRVVELTDAAAEIAFFQGGQEIGRSRFTMDDAKAAGLTGKAVWKQYPRNMLFSRAMSNGARWHCPDVLSGVTPYTPEEIGADVSMNDDGDVIDVTPTVKDEPEPEPRPTNGNRPISPDKLLPGLRHKAGWFKEQDGYKRNVATEPITDKQIGMVAGRIESLFPNVDADMKKKGRYDVLRFLFGVTSAKDLTKNEASALIDWTEDQDAARQEAAQILMAIATEAGQQEMEF